MQAINNPQPVFGGFGAVPFGNPNAQPIFGGFGNPNGHPAMNHDQLQKIKCCFSGSALKIFKEIDLSNYIIDKSIDKIIFECKVNNLEFVPNHVKHVIFNNYTENINGLGFNEGIEIIEIIGDRGNCSYTHLLDNLPKNLKSLNIKTKFNLALNNLPNSLKYLKIKDIFNQPVDNLPDGLEYLDLGLNFNQPINNLPSNLKVLILGRDFNQPIDNLPQELKTLVTDRLFNQDIYNLPNLEHYSCKNIKNDSIFELPKSLKSLTILEKEYDIELELSKNIFPNLKKLYINGYNLSGYKGSFETIKNQNPTQEFKNIPNGVIELIINEPNIYNESDNTDDDVKQDNTTDKILISNDDLDTNLIIDLRLLPSSIKKLKIINSYCSGLILPDSITHLSLLNISEDINLDNLPGSLRYLELSKASYSYDEKIYLKNLPPNLEQIVAHCGIFNIEEIKYLYPEINISYKNDEDY